MDVTKDTSEPARGNAAPDGAARGSGGEASLTQAVRWRAPVVSVPRAASQPRNPSLPTFVGLIILILTFFIVLTSISMKDRTKSDAAIASLQEAFSGSAASTQEEPDKKDDEAAYIAGLTNRIQSLVPLMGGKKAPASDHQVLWLPIELAFPAATTAPAPLFSAVLQEVVKSLRDVPERLTPYIEMRLCAQEPSDQLRARAVAIGAVLSAAHAPLRQFSVGVSSCDPARIGIAIALQAAEPSSRAEGQAP